MSAPWKSQDWIRLVTAIAASAAVIIGASNGLKADRIHVLVNSAATKAADDLAAANKQIAILHEQVDKLILKLEPKKP